MPAKLDLCGRTFGRLTVIAEARPTGEGNSRATRWKCECFCGRTTTVRTKELRYGRTQSCGCLQKEQAARIGRGLFRRLYNSAPFSIFNLKEQK